MAAHLRPLAHCQEFGCERPATVELFNALNARSRVYCSPHGKRALARFEARNPDQAAKR